MQRVLALFLTTEFDEYVQATFFACFSRFLQFRKGSADEEARWKNDAFEFLLYTSELHMQCGMVEISLVNLLSACELRLQMARNHRLSAPSSAAIVEKLLRDIDLERLRHLPDRRLVHRLAMILEARRLQEVEVASQATQLALAVRACPVFLQNEVAEQLPMTKEFLTESFSNEGAQMGVFLGQKLVKWLELLVQADSQKSR
eukprot:Skav236508  [mRNA]  locus=scaffold78:386196:386801:+ [translate_table: standard]